MLFRTHLIIGIFFGIIFSIFFENSFLFVLLVVLFSLIADIDIQFSKIGRRKCLRPIQWLAGHRKIFHSFIFVIVVGLVISFFSVFAMWAFLLGYSLHIVFDSLTKMGTQPLYPFEFRVRGFIKTGGWIEAFIFVLFFIGFSWIILSRFI